MINKLTSKVNIYRERDTNNYIIETLVASKFFYGNYDDN